MQKLCRYIAIGCIGLLSACSPAIPNTKSAPNTMHQSSIPGITYCPENLNDNRELLIQSKFTGVDEFDFIDAHPEVLQCAPEEPTCYSEFASPKDHVSILIPYNPKWGGTEFKILPFDNYPENSGGWFGQVCVGEGGYLHRLGQVAIKPKRSLEEAEKKVQQDMKNLCGSAQIQRITINGRPAITALSDGCDLGYPTIIEVFGEKNNYRFFGNSSLIKQAAEHITEL